MDTEAAMVPGLRDSEGKRIPVQQPGDKGEPPHGGSAGIPSLDPEYDDAVHRRKFRSRCVLALLGQGHQDLHRVQYRTMELEAFVFDGGEMPDGAEDADSDGPPGALWWDEDGEIDEARVAAVTVANWPEHRDEALLKVWRSDRDVRGALLDAWALAEAWALPFEAVLVRLCLLVDDDLQHGTPPDDDSEGGAA